MRAPCVRVRGVRARVFFLICECDSDVERKGGDRSIEGTRDTCDTDTCHVNECIVRLASTYVDYRTAIGKSLRRSAFSHRAACHALRRMAKRTVITTVYHITQFRYDACVNANFIQFAIVKLSRRVASHFCIIIETLHLSLANSFWPARHRELLIYIR